jgi:predicted ABC-type exoprotein transport system permease subunit
MFSNSLIALLVGLGGGAWVYNKLLRHTGNNKKNSLIAAGITAFIIFILFDLIVGTILRK